MVYPNNNTKKKETTPEKLARALLECNEKESTGCLEIVLYRQKHRIYLRKGLPCYIELHGGQEPLGMILMDMTALAPNEMGTTLRQCNVDFYGRLLIRQGIVEPPIIMQALRMQLERRWSKVYSLEEDVRFLFKDGESTRASEAGMTVHPYELLYEASHTPVNLQRALSRLAGPLAGQVIRISALGIDVLSHKSIRKRIQDLEWRVIDRLRQGKTLAEILSFSNLSSAETAALLEFLICINAVSVNGLCNSLDLDKVVKTSSESDTLKNSGGPASRLAEELRRVLQGGVKNPYRILGIESDADSTTLNSAYRRRVFLLHPDRWGRGRPPPSDLSALFSAVVGAYRSLSSAQYSS